MKSRKLWAMVTTPALVMAGSFVISGCGEQTPTATTIPANAQKVHVTASDWKWTMDKTTFKAGVPIDFIVQSSTSTHGFSLVGTNISHIVAQGGQPVNIVWTPPAAGQYTVKCNVYCGSGHDNMFDSFTVQ